MTDPVLCWDIDGTLLTTSRAGVYALESATLAVTGRSLDLGGITTAGLTDVEITRLILQHHGVQPTPENIARLLRLYEDDLPASLHRKQGHVMPGVRPILEELRNRTGWGSMLLTGNTRRGAAAKLRHYGLAEFFSGGAFSDDTIGRNDVAAKAVATILAERPGFPLSRVVVIGDTVHDIACARAVGARAFAVATGGANLPTLQAAKADVVLAQLPAPEEFFRLVEKLCGAA